MWLLGDTLLLILDALALPWDSEALADNHVSLCLGHERIADILFASRHPAAVVLLAEWPDGHVAVAAHVFASNRWRLRSDVVNVHFQFFTEGFQGQIVNIVAEGVLDFATNGGETDAGKLG